MAIAYCGRRPEKAQPVNGGRTVADWAFLGTNGNGGRWYLVTAEPPDGDKGWVSYQTACELSLAGRDVERADQPPAHGAVCGPCLERAQARAGIAEIAD